MRELLLELFVRFGLSDALSASALRGLDHDRVADFRGTLQTFFQVANAGLAVEVLGDLDRGPGLTLGGRLGGGEAGAGPGEGGHAGRLGHDRAGDLVAEEPHGVLVGAHEHDAVLGESFGQLWVLGGVTPTRPDRCKKKYIANSDNASIIAHGILEK